MKKVLTFLNPIEWAIWAISTITVITVFFAFHNTDYIQLVGCLIGVLSILLVSKGSPIGQITTILFSVFYGIVSYFIRYYGEMITYLGMTTPIAIVALINWFRHPSKANKEEVEVNHLKWQEYVGMLVLAAGVTVGFYFILRALNTNNLLFSTLSVYTSFIAAYMTMRRSRWYAVGYMLNDVIILVLWSLAAKTNSSYLAMVVTSITFLVNDLYGFINWTRLSKKQMALVTPEQE